MQPFEPVAIGATVQAYPSRHRTHASNPAPAQPILPHLSASRGDGRPPWSGNKSTASQPTQSGRWAFRPSCAQLGHSDVTQREKRRDSAPLLLPRRGRDFSPLRFSYPGAIQWVQSSSCSAEAWLFGLSTCTAMQRQVLATRNLKGFGRVESWSSARDRSDGMWSYPLGLSRGAAILVAIKASGFASMCQAE